MIRTQPCRIARQRVAAPCDVLVGTDKHAGAGGRLHRLSGRSRRIIHLVDDRPWRPVHHDWMADRHPKTTLLRIYDQVNLALWAALTAFLIFFALVIVPQMPHHQADAQAARAAAREREDAFYCKRWGLAHGSEKFSKCMTDLIELRRSIDTQFSEDLLP